VSYLVFNVFLYLLGCGKYVEFASKIAGCNSTLHVELDSGGFDI